MQDLINAFGDKIAEHWFSSIAGLLSSLFILRQKYIRDDHRAIKEDIKILQQQQIKLKSAVQYNCDTQEQMRTVQTEIRTDIKTLLARRSADIQLKKWFWQ